MELLQAVPWMVVFCAVMAAVSQLVEYKNSTRLEKKIRVTSLMWMGNCVIWIVMFVIK